MNYHSDNRQMQYYHIFNHEIHFQAQYDCRNQPGRGDLVKVDTQDFWKALKSQITTRSEYWIGGYQSTWQWVNGMQHIILVRI